MAQKIFIVIPVYNEESVIRDVVKEIQKAGYKNIIIVNDGSTDETSSVVKTTSAILLEHMINRGKGAAVKTGADAAKYFKADIVITMDGDGQHNPSNIKEMIDLIKKGYDVVLGSRLLKPDGMPYYKRLYNHIGNFFTWLIYGMFVSDSQSGLRAYSKNALAKIDTRTDRYEYDSEVIREIHRNKLRHIEFPIDVRYTEYSTQKKAKQNIVNGIKTLFRMFISIL